MKVTMGFPEGESASDGRETRGIPERTRGYDLRACVINLLEHPPKFTPSADLVGEQRREAEHSFEQEFDSVLTVLENPNADALEEVFTRAQVLSWEGNPTIDQLINAFRTKIEDKLKQDGSTTHQQIITILAPTEREALLGILRVFDYVEENVGIHDMGEGDLQAAEIVKALSISPGEAKKISEFLLFFAGITNSNSSIVSRIATEEAREYLHHTRSCPGEKDSTKTSAGILYDTISTARPEDGQRAEPRMRTFLRNPLYPYELDEEIYRVNEQITAIRQISSGSDIEKLQAELSKLLIQREAASPILVQVMSQGMSGEFIESLSQQLMSGSLSDRREMASVAAIAVLFGSRGDLDVASPIFVRTMKGFFPNFPIEVHNAIRTEIMRQKPSTRLPLLTPSPAVDVVPIVSRKPVVGAVRSSRASIPTVVPVEPEIAAERQIFYSDLRTLVQKFANVGMQRGGVVFEDNIFNRISAKEIVEYMGVLGIAIKDVTRRFEGEPQYNINLAILNNNFNLPRLLALLVVSNDDSYLTDFTAEGIAKILEAKTRRELRKELDIPLGERNINKANLLRDLLNGLEGLLRPSAPSK